MAKTVTPTFAAGTFNGDERRRGKTALECWSALEKGDVSVHGSSMGASALTELRTLEAVRPLQHYCPS